MYGTVARMQLKPGSIGKMKALTKEHETLNIPGHVNTLVYQMDENPDVVYLVVAFENKEAYVANASDPKQNARFEAMKELLAAAPEWHDGEVVYQMS